MIIGSDEVGYGSWAGPMYACAVAVTDAWSPPPGLTDSKKLTPAARDRIYAEIYRLPSVLAYFNSDLVDSLGVGVALRKLHTLVIKELLKKFPEADVVVDGVMRLPELPQARLVPHADATVPAVSAASIIAKVNRDKVMQEYHKKYPQYGFDKHVGYGTKQHSEALLRYGVLPIHRRSYSPIQAVLKGQPMKVLHS